jgi:hypothetical protein
MLCMYVCTTTNAQEEMWTSILPVLPVCTISYTATHAKEVDNTYHATMLCDHMHLQHALLSMHRICIVHRACCMVGEYEIRIHTTAYHQYLLHATMYYQPLRVDVLLCRSMLWLSGDA